MTQTRTENRTGYGKRPLTKIDYMSRCMFLELEIDRLTQRLEAEMRLNNSLQCELSLLRDRTGVGE